VLCEVGPRDSRRQKTESTLGIFREISRLPDALHRLSAALQAVAESQREHAPAADRLDDLERSRSIWEAECEAELLKATSKYKAAAAAEQRMRKLSDKVDPFTEEGDDVEAGVPALDAFTSEAEGLQPVHQGLAFLDAKQQALRMKFS